MNQKELKELIEFLIEKDIAEFELERGDVKLRVKRAGEAGHSGPQYLVHAAPPMVAAPTALTASPPEPVKAEPAPVAEEKLHTVRSPIVGTFYESPSPGAPPFVKVGDVVEVGQL